METLLETRDLTVSFGGHVAVNGVSVNIPKKPPHVHHRSQRRGKDHLFQPAERATEADPGEHPV